MSYPSKTHMVVKSLDLEKDPFRPRDDEEQMLGPEFPYLIIIGALMYLANSSRPDIAFVVNLLARHSSAPTKRHCVGIKNIFRYLNGIKDLGLFYKRSNYPSLIGYCRCFYPEGVPGPTSKLSPRAPAQMGRRETEREGGRKPEGDRRKRGNPRPLCLSRAQVGCACSRGLQASAREGARGLCTRRPVLPRAANPL
jgi:hypothetical protein